MKLFIANKNYSSWSLRPWVLMKTLDIPFEETLVPFPAEGSWDTYRKFSPSGKVPVLQDGDITVWDSLAIVEYLAEQHAGVWPTAAPARAWARSAAAEMHAGFAALRSTCTMNCGIRVVLDATSPELEADIRRIGELWSEGKRHFGGPFLAGESFTAVDAFFAPIAFRAQTYGLVLDPDAEEYVALLLRQPAMEDWYASALAETYREPGHEAEAQAVGTWTADLRA